MSKKEINTFLRDYSNGKNEVLAAEQAEIETANRLKAEAEEIDAYARENISEYKTLNSPNQSMIRKVIREGRAKGVGDSDLLAYAKIAAHSGLDVVFSAPGENTTNAKFKMQNAELGNERQYAIKVDTEGNKFVSVDSEIVKDTDTPKQIAKTLSDIVSTKFSELVDVNGQKIGIKQKTAREWVRSRSAQTLRERNPQAYTDKANAFGNADEILKATKDYIGEQAKHSRTDSFVEFARGIVSFSVGERGYEADVIVGTTKSGTAILYDLVNIQNKKIVADTSYTEQFRRSDASATDNSIYQKAQKVNTSGEKSFAIGENTIRRTVGDAGPYNGEGLYDGYYEAEKNRIVVNPESKRGFERILLHELDHAIRKENGGVVKVFKEAIEGVDEDTRKKIYEKYKSVAPAGQTVATALDETNAYFSEIAFSNKHVLEKLIEAEPTMKDKILSFFKGASTDYADVPKLSGAAKKYYRTYKKLFDEFSARNSQAQALENSKFGIRNSELNVDITSENANKKPLTSINQGNMQVSGRQYAIKFLSEDDLQQYLKAGNRSNKYKQEALNSGKKIILTTPEETRAYIEKSISGEKDLPVVAYGVVDKKLSQDVSNYSKNKINIENYYLELVSNDIHHAYQEHLKAKEKGDIDLSFEDFARIPYFVATYDDFLYAIKYKNGSTKICVSKKTSDGRVLLIETVSKSHGSIEFKNLIGVSEQKYIEEYENKYKKRNSTNTGGNVSSNNSPRDASVSSISIPQPEQKSNSSDKNSSENSSDKQFALPIDEDGEERISGGEVMSWLKDKPESDGKLDLEATVERGLPYRKGRSNLTVANSTQKRPPIKIGGLKIYLFAYIIFFANSHISSAVPSIPSVEELIAIS